MARFVKDIVPNPSVDKHDDTWTIKLNVATANKLKFLGPVYICGDDEDKS